MNIQAINLANLFSYTKFRKISENTLRNYLIDPKLDVCNADNYVTIEEFLNVFEFSLKTSKDSYFGLHYGCFLNIKALGFINQLTFTCTNIEQAIFFLQKYLENSFPIVRLDFSKSEQNCVLKLESNIDNKVIKNQILDIVFCFIYRELKLMIPDKSLPILEIPHSNVSIYSDFLKEQVFEGLTYRFVFDIKILETTINKKTANNIALLLPKFLQMLDKNQFVCKKFSQQVRDMILNLCTPDLPNFDQVAAHFPISKRTFQRKLTNEGISFRQIIDSIKNELAIFLLKDNKIKTNEIAIILGYSNSSAYLHAAKKWKQ